MAKPPVYLVDGSGYIFRAFYAVAPLTTTTGFPTNALFGYTRMLLKLLNECNSPYVSVVFDAGKETFRNEMFADYKANRTAPPDELLLQFPYFATISSALGMPTYEMVGFEADDIIGTLATKLAANGHQVTIVTADKDLMQLVNTNINLWDTMRDRRFSEAEVIEKMGVPPRLVTDYLGMVGDSSDNIPGLTGVGPKTAAQLIELYGDIESVISNVALIREDSRIRNRKKIGDQIEFEVEKLRLSKRLATIDIKVPVNLMHEGHLINALDSDPAQILAGLTRTDPNKETLDELTRKFEFSNLFSNLPKPIAAISVGDEAESAAETKMVVPENYHTVFAKDFDAWCEKFLATKEFAFDLETSSLVPWDCEIAGVAVCWNADEAFYIPINHTDKSEPQVDWNIFVEKCGATFANASIKKIGQNLKYDASVMASHGITVKGITFDSMIAAYLLSPDRRAFSLGALAKDFLHRTVSEYEDVIGDAEDFRSVPITAATAYAAEDAHIAWLLRDELAPKIDAEKLTQVFNEIEMPLVGVLAKVEARGVKIDAELLAGISDEYSQKLDKMRIEIVALAGGDFNMNSTKQLAEILFTKLEIPTKGIKKTKTGFSTDSSVLEKIRHLHPLPDLILEYRTLHKLKSTYIDALPAQISTKTGRLHTKFNQTVTGTGRLSSSDPNLQNIPIQSEEGRRIRMAFIPEPGKVLISADYSQIELRLLAHMSGDQNMIAAFNEGADIHERTARELFKIGPFEDVPSDKRRVGKTINFGVVYGMGAFRLAQELGISSTVAQKYIDEYFARYPNVRRFFANLENDALQKGEVRTLYGRRRVISDLDTSGRDKGFLLRAAVNAPIQGTAADIIKLAMIKIEDNIPSTARLILQIHDELVLECDSNAVDSTKEFVREAMENVIELSVPLKVGVSAGRNWEEAHR